MAAPASGIAQTPPDARPLSPAQVALFETPHLRNVVQGETLDYAFVREGPDAFTGQVAMHVSRVNADGSKDLSFEFLDGPRRMPYPEIDSFQGNPLVMLVLERDVRQMKESLGLSASYFRERIRRAFVTGAHVSAAAFTMNGKSVPATLVTVQPFADDARLDRLPSVQQKTYAFVLAKAVPGMLAEVRTSMPADAGAHIPAAGERMTFQGVTP